MRAAMTLAALADRFDIHLCVVAPVSKNQKPPAHILAQCRAVRILSPSNLPDASQGRPLLTPHDFLPIHTSARLGSRVYVPDVCAAFDGLRPQAVFVFRIFMAPFVEHLLRGRRPIGRVLDIDDYESEARPRRAAIFSRAGKRDRVRTEVENIERYRQMELAYLPLFDRTYVCSEIDRQKVIRDHGRAPVSVLPNAVSIPTTSQTRSGASVLTVLFVGTLGYYPNEDAVLHFCARVLPLILKGCSQPLQLVLVGSEPPEAVLALNAHPGIRVVGWVRDPAEWYARADLAVVPLRAGGGTRIKILEAFSHRVPVVSTRIGAEGLDVSPGRHLLLADRPGTFARRCQQIIENPEQAAAMAQRSYDWLLANHTIDQVRSALKQTLPDVDI